MPRRDRRVRDAPRDAHRDDERRHKQCKPSKGAKSSKRPVRQDSFSSDYSSDFGNVEQGPPFAPDPPGYPRQPHNSRMPNGTQNTMPHMPEAREQIYGFQAGPGNRNAPDLYGPQRDVDSYAGPGDFKAYSPSRSALRASKSKYNMPATFGMNDSSSGDSGSSAQFIHRSRGRKSYNGGYSSASENGVFSEGLSEASSATSYSSQASTDLGLEMAATYGNSLRHGAGRQGTKMGGYGSRSRQEPAGYPVNGVGVSLGHKHQKMHRQALDYQRSMKNLQSNLLYEYQNEPTRSDRDRNRQRGQTPGYGYLSEQDSFDRHRRRPRATNSDFGPSGFSEYSDSNDSMAVKGSGGWVTYMPVRRD